VRFFPLSERDDAVTKPEEGDDFSAAIPVEEIRAYEVAAVPAPVNLAQGLPLPIRVVEHVRVKTEDGWQNL